MALVYLDACAIIEAVEKPTPEGQAIVDLMAGSAGDDTPFVTSELSLLEVLVVPVRGLSEAPTAEDEAVRRSHRDWYAAQLAADGVLIRTAPIARETLVEAARIRARIPSIRTPDAIHLATARGRGCAWFVTADRELVRRVERDGAWPDGERRFDFVPVSVQALTNLGTKLLA